MYTFAIYPMDADIALRVGSLDADMQAAGQKIGLPDIVIAATALHLGFSVATRNARDFQRVPGLRIAESITPR
jgi:tRNA(fMet)-specific endonuclease VapC